LGLSLWGIRMRPLRERLRLAGIRDEEDWRKHLEYIRKNPVRAGLVSNAFAFEFMGFQGKDFPQGLKPADF